MSVDGKTISIFRPFTVGESTMMFQLDQSLGASLREICRCRCVCKYSGKNGNRVEDNVQNTSNNLRAPMNLQFFSDVENARKELKRRINSGETSLKVRWEKQQEHIDGTKKREERIKREIEQKGKATSTSFAIGTTQSEIQEMINNFSTKGIPVLRKDGQIAEYVSVDRIVGQVYNEDTDRICIKYSHKGTHSFPVNKRR